MDKDKKKMDLTIPIMQHIICEAGIMLPQRCKCTSLQSYKEKGVMVTEACRGAKAHPSHIVPVKIIGTPEFYAQNLQYFQK